MPKENINNENERDPVTRIELSWQQDAYVQLTTALRREVPATADEPAHVTYDTGAYVGLTRYGINRLIHALRRARDVAYGKDA